jgi:hypothetical protein
VQRVLVGVEQLLLALELSSIADSAPTYMMFLNSWRWRGSVYSRLAIAVSGTPITVMSGRNFDGGIGLVES